MNLGNDESIARDFTYYLDIALNEGNLNANQLAKEIDITRQHITSLRKGGVIPSSKLLKKICEALNKKGVEFCHIVPLLYAALDMIDENTIPMLEGLPYPFSYEPKDKSLESRCIITDKLGECIYEDVFNETITALRENIIYYYFLPHQSSDWQRMLVKAGSKAFDAEKLVRENSYCIKCPSCFIYSRIRIDNITCPNPETFINVGSTATPSLRRLSPEIASNVINIAAIVVEKAKRAREEKISEVVYQGEGIMLKFELESDSVV